MHWWVIEKNEKRGRHRQEDDTEQGKLEWLSWYFNNDNMMIVLRLERTTYNST